MRQHKGFTLLEVMLVMVVIGFMLTALIPNIRGVNVEDELETQSQRFNAVFTLASEYALLNNIELGLYVEKNSYQFLGFDGAKWLAIPDIDTFAIKQFEEPWSIELILDGLEVDDEMIIEQSLFEDMETEDSFTEKEEEKSIYPQVYILSGGDITPFRLTFTHDDGMDLPVYYEVNGAYTIPLIVTGPFFDES